MMSLSEEQAIAAIESFGGFVWYDQAGLSKECSGHETIGGASSPVKANRKTGVLAYLDAPLRHVLEYVSALNGVERLWIAGGCLTQEDLASIAKLTSLVELNLGNTDLSDTGVDCIASLRGLKSLALYKTWITDRALRRISQFPELMDLNLANTGITDLGLSYLPLSKKLCALDISGTAITDGAIAVLAQVRTLRILYIHGTAISDKGLQRLRESLPFCQVIVESAFDFLMSQMTCQRREELT